MTSFCAYCPHKGSFLTSWGLFNRPLPIGISLGMPNHPLSMARLATPQLLKPTVTTAVSTVEFVTDRVFLVIVLVIILGRVKLGGLHILSHNRSLEGFVLLQ